MDIRFPDTEIFFFPDESNTLPKSLDNTSTGFPLIFILNIAGCYNIQLKFK